jgi:DeoR/GlpR family transcriptional regulator of sugar metabolism
LEILEEKRRVQVGDLKEVFPKVSKRTLRRDFKFLIQQGLVEKVGEKNNTFYQLRR